MNETPCFIYSKMIFPLTFDIFDIRMFHTIYSMSDSIGISLIIGRDLRWVEIWKRLSLTGSFLLNYQWLSGSFQLYLCFWAVWDP